jgi:uncharacterized protein involved in exopolysaccharide biosynthesis/Mrp family chromosome partitioning ATPase
MQKASSRGLRMDLETAREGFGQPPAVDLQKIFSVLWRDKSTLWRSTAVALLLALIVAVLVPSRYTATTQMLIDPTDLQGVSRDMAQANMSGDTAVIQVESQLRVLTSDNVLRRVVTAERLDADPEFVGSSFANDPVLIAMNTLRRDTVVKRAERTYVVDISVTLREPEKAAQIANAIAKAYLTEQTDARSDAARQISQSLTARLNELKNRVRTAEDKVEAFKAKNNIVGVNGELINEQQLSELNKQLGLARAQTAGAKSRLEQIEQVQKSGDIGAFTDAIQSPTIASLRAQYAELMRRAAQQMASLGPRHPAVIELQAEIERLHSAINEELRRVAASTKTDYETAHSKEEMLTNTLEQQEGSTISTNEALVTLRELQRDVTASRAIYEAFLARARETGEQERLDTKNIRVITPAEMPLYRSFPPSNLILALAALFLGLASGTLIIFMREAYGVALPSPAAGSEFRGREFGGGGFGSGFGGAFNGGGLTTVFSSGGRLFSALENLWSGLRFSRSIPVLAVLPSLDLAFGLRAARASKTPLAADMRGVFAALGTDRARAGRSRILVVSSTDEDDTVLVALALATVGAADHRVLLVDVDLDRRTLSALDAEQSDGGLVDVALGRRDLSEVVVRDPETDVNLVPFVSANSRRDRRINEHDLRSAFDRTTNFDLVIAAAIGLTSDPGTSFFATLVDKIVLVVRCEEQTTDVINHFMTKLGADARKVCGAIVIESD